MGARGVPAFKKLLLQAERPHTPPHTSTVPLRNLPARTSPEGSGAATKHPDRRSEHPAKEAAKVEERLGEEDLLSREGRLTAALAPPPWIAPSPIVAVVAPPVAAPPVAALATNGKASLEELFGAGVRRVAWGGDARKGTARVEMGDGALDGAVVTVHAEGRSVRIEVAGAEGERSSTWAERVRARLEARGLEVEEIAFR